MSGYNAHQQVFQLSLMSFLAKNVKGTQTDIQAAMEKKLPHALAHLPGWEIVWGPVAWKFGPDHKIGPPDHVFFVVKHPNLAFSNGEKKETYVLSIAGTQSLNNWGANGLVSNGVNFHEWLKRGITTKPVKDESPSPSSCYIAEGTADGVYRLVTVVPPPSAASPGVDIPTYWASFPDSPNTRVIITGHSMGGALAPALALGLLESGALAKFSPSNVLVYPTAGPTAGNLQFAKLFADRFPKVPGPLYEVWNCMIVNLRDPVAQAWCTSEKKSPKQNMHNIPTIFGEPALDVVKTVVNFGVYLVDYQGFSYMPIQAVWFEGTPPPSPPTDLEMFNKFVWEQHTDELLKWMNNMKRVECQVLTGEENGLERMSSLEEARTEPLMCELAARAESQQEEEEDLEEYQAMQALSENYAM